MVGIGQQYTRRQKVIGILGITKKIEFFQVGGSPYTVCYIPQVKRSVSSMCTNYLGHLYPQWNFKLHVIRISIEKSNMYDTDVCPECQAYISISFLMLSKNISHFILLPKFTISHQGSKHTGINLLFIIRICSSYANKFV